MHMQGQTATMQESPRYRDPVDDVKQFLRERVSACEQAGIARQLLVLDPGFGFGKNLNHNLELLRRLPEFAELGCPLLAGLSRKSMLGGALGRDVRERLPGSWALAMAAAERGARLIRVPAGPAPPGVLK